MATVSEIPKSISGHPAGHGGAKIKRDPRRRRNIRLGLVMGAIALFFYFFIMFKYLVLMA